MRPSRRLSPTLAALAALTYTAACGGPPVVTTNVPAAPRPVVSAPIDLTVPPTLGPPPALRLPPITTRTLPNGLTLVVVEQHELPLVDVILDVRTGGEADPAGKSGAASLTAGMLTEGTTTRSSLQIADQAAYLGVRVGASSGWEQSTVSLHAPTAQLDSALALFADVALHPAFNAPDLERVRKVRLTALQQVRDRGPAIADRAFATALYGEQHPYGRPLSGSEASVADLTRDDLVKFYTTFYRPNNATLLVVGDVRPDDMERRAINMFGGWTRADVPTVNESTASGPKATTLVLIDKPGAAQSSFRIGGIGVPRSTKDYFAIQVMNTILGGSFTSRLNQNLRETHGYTYGAGSGFSMRRTAGPFQASAEVVSAKTDSAFIEFMKELRAIRDTVPSDELAKAKRYLQLGLPEDFETTGSIAYQMLPLVTYGIPLDFYDTAVQKIGAVTQADVQRVARQYVNPDRLTIVIVGDRKLIEPGLRALNPGEIVIRDVRDVLGAVPVK
ncbi:MAG TPA: pitrilysin family protein [Gemmatimonadaceae bacterium]|nr:pitrilysin family protein [Gemmatimonadaceae bacterium]